MSNKSGIMGTLQKPTPMQWVNGRYVAVKEKVKAPEKPGAHTDNTKTTSAKGGEANAANK